MTIRVDRDGKIVQLVQGYTEVAGRKIPVGYNEVATAGSTYADDQVSEEVLKRIQDGEVTGLSWHDDEEPPPPESEPEPRGASAFGPAVDPDAGPDLYDPSEHNQGDVLEYLKTADPAEVERVQAVEADGQNRKGIADFEPKED